MGRVLIISKYSQVTLQRCYVVMLAVLILIPFIYSSSTSARPSLSPDQTKAALLYNFIKHIYWPNEEAMTNIRIGFVGDKTALYTEFSKIAAQVSVRGKSLSVDHVDMGSPLPVLQVLVLDKSLNTQVDSVLAQLAQQQTLLVSDAMIDKNKVMLNFIYEGKKRLSFELNKSNVIFQGMRVSNDILLHGGSEIEVATLYKQMQDSLASIKGDVIAQKQNLKKLVDELSNKNTEVSNKAELIAKQELAIVQSIDALAIHKRNVELKEQQLQEQEASLLRHQKEMLLSKEHLSVYQLKMLEMEADIRFNQSILDSQSEELLTQQQVLKSQVQELEKKGQTIGVQRYIIIVILSLLLVIAALVVIRQKKALLNERRLFESEASLVKAQQESIEAYESSLQLKNDFLTAINHELRTPMNGVLGALQIADHTSISSLQRSVSLIQKSADGMLSLVEDILSYTELQSEQSQLHPASQEVQAWLLAIEQRYRPRCDEKSLSLTWDVDPCMPAQLIFDGERLQEALYKLLDNALKFTHEGDVSVAFTYLPLGHKLGANGESEAQLQVDIIDSGRGIKEEEREHVFEPFRQQEGGFSRSYGGLGIGLALCKSLLVLQGGDVELMPTEVGNSGCHFRVQLKVEVNEAPSVGLKQIKCDSPSSTGRHEQILVVEDNPVNQQILSAMLKKMNYIPLMAEHGKEALTLLDENSPVLVLMDLQMPVMDGFDCTRHIREREDESASLPIVALTANFMGSQESLCIQAGMNAYLKKPVDIKLLAATINPLIHAV